MQVVNQCSRRALRVAGSSHLAPGASGSGNRSFAGESLIKRGTTKWKAFFTPEGFPTADTFEKEKWARNQTDTMGLSSKATEGVRVFPKDSADLPDVQSASPMDLIAQVPVIEVDTAYVTCNGMWLQGA